MGGAAEQTDVVRLGAVELRFVHADASAPYSLLEWIAPAGAPAPPVHLHHATDEGFYVLAGVFAFRVDGATTEAHAGAHVLVRRGCPHTFWNVGDETARCLMVIAPPGFEAYFRELAAGLAELSSDEEAIELRRRLGVTYDIEVVEPPERS